MKIYSDTIGYGDIIQALARIERVCIDESGIRTFQGRDGRNGFELFLKGYGERHVRARNFGKDGKAATWDDWGIFITRLFRIDRDAKIGQYDGKDDFIEQTSQYQQGRAPWLDEDVSNEAGYYWPDAEQNKLDEQKANRRHARVTRQHIRTLRVQADRLEAQL